MVSGDRRSAAGGFTLVETLIALVLSSLVMILVSTTFLVQNRYHARHVMMAGAHDNARAATELVARELRSVVVEGVRAAGRHTLTVRSPVTVGTVCASPASIFGTVHIYLGATESTLDEERVAGIGLMESNGSWDLQTTSWGPVSGGSASAAQCFANGADTVGVRNEFHRFSAFFALFTFGNVPDVGEVVLLFRETTFTIEPSVMDPSTAGLFRRDHGGDPVEFATGVDTTSHFEYRTGGSTFSDNVSSGSLDDIDAVRIVLDARRRGEAGPGDEATFGLSTTVELRNAP